MSRMVKCTKLGKEAAGLEKAPFPGQLGERIFENISQEAWNMWLEQQTILINEHRLALFKPEARQFLEGEMEKFLFT